ncbi:hypothetical protein GIB67_019933 [Kingdonia uniflora]|uniref:Leucine-rich repeat-containing N-terminal plant-type domain-containing protein n=1 Tax=Kingdonia uniflora TaxID=39325 RepID=A0A7J7MKM7_9MAGN|nr:hypothetical protein GIB67_019933 [Kingdonia uniflora]
MVYLPFFILLCTGTAATFGNMSDRLALIAFKEKITPDPLGVMSSWNDSVHFCNWTGATCSDVHRERIMFLELQSLKLVSSISPSIGNLTFLIGINLESNGFSGEIPQEFGRLLRLQHLNLSDNSLDVGGGNRFTGSIPVSFSNASGLQKLDLSSNNFTGLLPVELGTLRGLYILNLEYNQLGSGSEEANDLNVISFGQLC